MDSHDVCYIRLCKGIRLSSDSVSTEKSSNSGGISKICSAVSTFFPDCHSDASIVTAIETKQAMSICDQPGFCRILCHLAHIEVGNNCRKGTAHFQPCPTLSSQFAEAGLREGRKRAVPLDSWPTSVLQALRHRKLLLKFAISQAKASKLSEISLRMKYHKDQVL